MRDAFGQFILNGSASPLNNKDEQTMRQSGARRLSTIVMRSMSLYDSLYSNGTVSLNSLLNVEKIAPTVCYKKLIDYAQYACRGDWPKSVGVSKKISVENVK